MLIKNNTIKLITLWLSSYSVIYNLFTFGEFTKTFSGVVKAMKL